MSVYTDMAYEDTCALEDGEYISGLWAFDCDPDFIFEDCDYDMGLDIEDDTGDWQVLVLDRFGDRSVTEWGRTQKGGFFHA